MKLRDVIDEIKLELTGNVLDIELEQADLKLVVNKALRELERYWDETTLITVPYASCIDLTDFDHSTIVHVYRSQAAGNVASNSNDLSAGSIDPVYAQQWMIFSNGGTMYNLQDYVLNYAAWNTMSQIRNTLSTDLDFTEDKHNNKLYINNYMASYGKVTIEYVPKIKSVEDIKSEYWIDILIRICVSLTKQILGRIRTRFSQSNPLWAQDGDKLLEEGNSELKELREILRTNANMVYPID